MTIKYLQYFYSLKFGKYLGTIFWPVILCKSRLNTLAQFFLFMQTHGIFRTMKAKPEAKTTSKCPAKAEPRAKADLLVPEKICPQSLLLKTCKVLLSKKKGSSCHWRSTTPQRRKCSYCAMCHLQVPCCQVGISHTPWMNSFL